jgi:hypothetical protein
MWKTLPLKMLQQLDSFLELLLPVSDISLAALAAIQTSQ